MYKIAICDDDKRYRKTIREIVEHESGKKYSDLYNNIWPEAVNNFLALNKENIVDKKCDVVDMQYYIALSKCVLM